MSQPHVAIVTRPDARDPAQRQLIISLIDAGARVTAADARGELIEEVTRDGAPDVVHMRRLPPMAEEKNWLKTRMRVNERLAQLDALKQRGVGLVWSPDALSSPGASGDRLDRLLRAALLERADVIITRGAAAAGLLERHFNVACADRCVVVPHGWAAAEEFAVTRADAREAFGLEESAFVFADIGPLRADRGTDRVVAAWQAISERDERAWLILAGPNDLTRSQMDRVHSAVAGRSRVIFHPGPVEQEALPVYYGAADAVVLAHRVDVSGRLAVRAMGYGKPLLAADTGVLPELVGEGGWVCDGGAEALAKSMQRALSDRAAAMSMGEANLARAAEAHAWPQVVEQLLAAYRRAMEKAASR